jgi:uncharacterized protein (DUF934 family)
MPLLRQGSVVEDPFVSVVGRDELPARGPLIVSLEQWRSRRDELLARGERLGIRLENHESPGEIAGELEHFAVVALEFPSFNDGRAYSQARLLRERLGYRGELRAVGDVLLEQLQFMERTGFDAFEIDSRNPVGDWQTAQSDIDVWYQPTGDGRRTAMELRRS